MRSVGTKPRAAPIAFMTMCQRTVLLKIDTTNRPNAPNARPGVRLEIWPTAVTMSMSRVMYQIKNADTASLSANDNHFFRIKSPWT